MVYPGVLLDINNGLIFNFGWSGDTTQTWKACTLPITLTTKLVYANALQYTGTSPGNNNYTTICMQYGLSLVTFMTLKNATAYKGEVFWMALGY